MTDTVTPSTPPSTAAEVSSSAVRGGTWVVGARLTDHGLVFLARLLVARWLGPEELGLYGVAILVVTIVETLTEPGIASAIVWRDQVERRHLDVAWTTACLRGAALAGIVALAAPQIAGFFDAPDAVPLIRGMALVLAVRGLVSPALILLERDLGFRVIALLGLVRSGVLFVGTLVLTLVLDSVEAIVVASVAAQVVHAVLSHLVRPLRLRFSLDRATVRELLRYGRWVTGSSVAVFLLLYLDDVVVGRTLGATALATYQIAYQIAGLPATEVSLLANRVTFSSFVKLRDERDALADAFLTIYEIVAMLTVPLSVLIAFEAGLVVDVLLGPGWEAAVVPLQILSLWGAFRALGAVTTPLLKAVGRPEVVAGFHWLMLAATAAALIPAVDRWGLEGAAWAVLAPNAVIHWFRYPFVTRPIGRRPVDLYRRLVPSVVAAAAMVAVLAVSRAAMPLPDDPTTLALIARLGVELLLAGCIYLAVHGALERAGLATSVSSARRLLMKAVQT